MEFSSLWQEQLRLHPSMQPRDAVKLCYQAAFGAEHLLQEGDAARAYFDAEFSQTPAKEQALCEPIAPGVCRVNIGAWKQRELPPAWLFAMFRLTASGGGAPKSREVFWQYLQDADMSAARGQTPFAYAAWRAFIDEYDPRNPRPVHHSEAYRQKEHPAYRLVSGHIAALIPLLARMTKEAPSQGAFICALDGRAASGKTTMAQTLAEITGAGLIHMDDFFLPAPLRTEERFAQPGGNVHYERFLQEVLPRLPSGEAFAYQVFDCAAMKLGGSRQVCASPWRVVEGVYSGHPALGEYMNVRVFCDIEPEEQLKRIRKRNGDEMAAVFQARWIPMEEAYFDACHSKEKADMFLPCAAERVY